MNIDRVKKMEGILDECRDATEALDAQLDRMDALRPEMMELFRYCGSEDWYQDREGELPNGMKAGVLSEDLAYDEMTAIRDAAFHMLDLATDILKNRI